MAEKYTHSLRGKKRREVETPETVPSIDTEAVLRFSEWRSSTYKKPILDRLNGYYLFPPTPWGISSYTRPNGIDYPFGIAAIGREAARKLIESRNEADEKRNRQVLHKAQSAEMATAFFWTIAVLRQYAINEVLESAKLAGTSSPSEEASLYAADALLNFGLCLENPFENNRRRGREEGLKTRLDRFSPDLGSQIASFGVYASKNPEALTTFDGIVLLGVARDEQQYHIDTWAPRHTTVIEQFPEIPISREILYQTLSFEEMVSIQDELEQNN